MGRVEGKIALITGGARGLGEATGRTMAKEGATVILTDMLDDLGEALAGGNQQRRRQGRIHSPGRHRGGAVGQDHL